MNKFRNLWKSFCSILLISAALSVSAPLLVSCEHKELYYPDSSPFRSLRVKLQWKHLEGHDMPEGMRVIFFPKDAGDAKDFSNHLKDTKDFSNHLKDTKDSKDLKDAKDSRDSSNNRDGKAEPWIFDFPYGEGRQIELPFNNYSVICFNNDADGIIWENPENYSRFSASTKIVETPDGNRACLTPPWLCGDHIGLISIRDTDSDQIITLHPKMKVSRYTFEVNGIRKLERVAAIRASLSEMLGKKVMAEMQETKVMAENDSMQEKRTAEEKQLASEGKLSESSSLLLFGGEVSGKQLKGGFYTFGYNPSSDAPIIFKLYLRSRSGKTHVVQQDVTEQIRIAEGNASRQQASGKPNPLADVHLVINLDFEIPEEAGGGSSGGAGFDVGVDDWGDINEDIHL